MAVEVWRVPTHRYPPPSSMVLGLQMLSQCCPGRSCRGRIDTLQTLSPKVHLLARSGFLASVMRLRVRNKDVMGHWSLYCERSGGTEGGTCELGRSLQLLLRYNPPTPNPLPIAMSNPQGNTPDSVFTPMPSPYMRSTPPKNSKRIPNFNQPAPVPWRHHPVEDNKILENTPFKLLLWLGDLLDGICYISTNDRPGIDEEAEISSLVLDISLDNLCP